MYAMDLKEISQKRQKKWKETDLYKVKEDISKPKFYILDMFPYPSGSALHVGHPKWYIATDCLARKKMLEGFNVLHPMGFDTFGLGTEQYAIDHKMKPQVVSETNIKTFITQLETFGTTYDRSRTVNTAEPKYFKWTQRVFLQMYNHYYDEKLKKAMPITDPSKQERLAYVDYKPINRCPKCMTGLANEDLDDGKCERCGSEVEQKPMKQRVLRITKYAERLLEGLDTLKRDESMKDLERNRIGKSEWTQFDMKIDLSSFVKEGNHEVVEDLKFSVYTTRIDTVFGMSFVAIAPEHPLVEKITTAEYKAKVEIYKEAANKKSQLERTELQKDKTGVFCGAYAINPFNGQKVPVFVADYVLANYGTWVVMAVPAHDERDFEFAKKYNSRHNENSKNSESFHDVEIMPRRDLPITQSIMPDSFDLKNPPRKDKKNTERNTVHVILRNTKDKTVLVHFLKGEHRWDLAPKNFIIGGIEDGESEIQAAVREITEETGYTNIKFIEKIPFEIQANFFAAHKDVNRKIHVNTLVFDLVWDESVEITEDEHFNKASHEAHWIPYEKVAETINIVDDEMSWKYFHTGGFAYTEKWIVMNSWEFSGLASDEAIIKMQAWLENKWIGGVKVNYKMQEWVFSRQRYRGEPFPIVRTEDGEIVALTEKDLPLELPDVENYAPTGTVEWPLANITDRVNVTLPDGRKGKRETNTMPGRAGSSRYRLRYMDVNNDEALVGKDKEKYRGSVDVYVGGAEHITRHMIYGRFRQKFLFDIGSITHEEPFQEYHSVGLIMGEDGRKMSKRRGNVVNPDTIINEFGTDVLRTYEMFMGPFDQSIAWSTNGIKWIKKFLEKIIALKDKISEGEESNPTLILLHQSIKKLTEDIDAFKFNTGVSQLMILVNHLTECTTISRKTFEDLIVLVSPFAPHLAEELREGLGNTYSIFTQTTWPKYEEKYLVADTVTMAVQINGKVRGTITLSKDAEEIDAMNLAKADEKIMTRITGEPKKVIYVKGKILNIVV